ncbi:hypothetical protein [Salinadaptatus halalkaliphilus]|uniref:hypothetical protein n=1 Tax=Salinadaptatus halalkaliphilus TaxID=2419781 RepID=UPI001580461D|nr:hypothetical protein [Salinadaptatus halalkaliphilus]
MFTAGVARLRRVPGIHRLGGNPLLGGFVANLCVELLGSDREARQVADLPIGELSLTQFSPSERVLRRAIYESALETFDFFSIPVSDVRPWIDARLGLR